MNPARRYKQVSESIVTVRAVFHPTKRAKTNANRNQTGSFAHYQDGVVISIGPNTTFIVTGDRILRSAKHRNVTVKYPSGAIVRPANVFTGHGISIIKCVHTNVGDLKGLKAIELFRGKLEECQIVHTYSSWRQFRVLSPGTILSVSAACFKHDCPASHDTEYGSPVVNDACELVGICFKFDENLTAYGIKSVMTKVVQYYGSTYKDIDAALSILS